MACRLHVLRQAIIWTNADAVYWRIYATLGEGELYAERVFVCSVNRYLKRLGTRRVKIRYSLQLWFRAEQIKRLGSEVSEIFEYPEQLIAEIFSGYA